LGEEFYMDEKIEAGHKPNAFRRGP
jgi:hypothetical protein